MPRGKFESHKGRCRQFTPVEELQRENEREGGCKSSERFHGHLNGKCKKMGGAVAGLIQISNPNRQIRKTVKFTLSAESFDTEISNEERRQERSKDKLRSLITQKTLIEINADLARLALVRKKREAAAERRLAAKGETTGELQNSKSELSSIYKNNNELKPNRETNDKKLMSENPGKYLKERNGNKHNANIHV